MITIKYISLIIFCITLLSIPFITFNAPHLLLGDIIIAFIAAFINRFVRYIMRNKVEDEFYKDTKM